MLRVKEKYGPTAILYQNDQHGENKIVHGPHGCGRKLLRLFGGYTHQVRNADSWEGWYWGAKHVWGCEYIGQQKPQKNLLWDIPRTRSCCSSGAVTRRRPHGVGAVSSPAD